MSRRKHLTPQQIKFAQLIVYNEGRKTATDCAIDSGYAKDRARSTASELQNPNYYPLVVQEINRLRKEINEKYRVSLETHMRDLDEIKRIALEAGSYSAAVQAEVARGKAGGLYIEQKIIKHGRIDQLSPDEIRKELEEIANQFKPKIIEGKAEEVTEH
jgi:phage terminase small subunit|tara:strand:- start:961 stop:1437 length:477 start_codon:yes stop_codon:yes gene_type:complete